MNTSKSPTPGLAGDDNPTEPTGEVVIGTDSGSGDGADNILGGKGKDSIDGGAGNDAIDGGSQSDTLFGGDGSGVFIFSGVTNNDVITDFEVGIDDIFVVG